MDERRKWVIFFAPPRETVIPVVWEFFANTPERRDCKAFVSGCLVPFDSVTIKEVLGKPPI